MSSTTMSASDERTSCEVFRPADVRRDPIHLLALHSAIADVGEVQSRRRVFGENAGDRAADGAEAEDGDVQRLLRFAVIHRARRRARPG